MDGHDERLSESTRKSNRHLEMSEVELFHQHLDSFAIEMGTILKGMNATLINMGEKLDRMNSKLDQCSAGIHAAFESSMR
jgi:hypothetical protein